MSTIVTRAGKGSALTYTEVDSNFTNLNTDKLEASTTATLTNKTIDYASNTLTGVQPTLVSGTSIKTVNGTSLLGSGNVTTGDVTTNGTQTLTNKTLTSPVLTTPTINDGYTEEVFAVTGTTPALAATNGSIQTWTLTDNSTPTDSLSSGQSILLGVTAGSFTITWPTTTWSKVGGSGTAPTLTSSGVTWIVLWKVGGTLRGALLGTA